MAAAKQRGAKPPRKSVPAGATANAEPQKVVHIPGSHTRPVADYIAWRFELIYNEPCFGWDTLSEDDRQFLHTWLEKFEGQTVNELFQGGRPGKTYNNPHQIPNDDARKRFLDCYEDEDAIHRLACGGAPRIYGFRRDNVFLILWWDPNHGIWPSNRS